MAAIIIPEPVPKTAEELSNERARELLEYLVKLEKAMRPQREEGVASTTRFDASKSKIPYGDIFQKLERASVVLLPTVLWGELMRIELEAEAAGWTKSQSGLVVLGNTALHQELRSQAKKVDNAMEDALRDLRGQTGMTIGMLCAEIDRANDGLGTFMNFHRSLLPEEVSHWREAVARAHETGNEDDSESLDVIGHAAQILQKVEGPRGYWEDNWMDFHSRAVVLYGGISLVRSVLIKNGQITPPQVKEAGKEASPAQEETMGVGGGQGAQRTSSVSSEKPLVQIYKPHDVLCHGLGHLAGLALRAKSRD